MLRLFKKSSLLQNFIYSLLPGFKDRIEFQRQIEESEQQFRLNFEYARDGILWFDTKNGQLINCNLASEWFLRDKVDELKGKYFHEVSTDCPKWKDFVKGLIKGGGSTVSEIVFNTGSQTRYARASGTKIRVDNEAIVQIILHDITHLKEVENALEAEKVKLEAVFNSAPAAMLLINEDAIICNANKEAKKLANRDLSLILKRKGGESIGCINSGNGCGHGQQCSKCKLRELIENTFTYWKAFKDEDIRFTFKECGKDDCQMKRLRVSTEPLLIESERYILLCIDDVTRSKSLEDKAKALLSKDADISNYGSYEI